MLRHGADTAGKAWRVRNCVEGDFTPVFLRGGAAAMTIILSH